MKVPVSFILIVAAFFDSVSSYYRPETEPTTYCKDSSENSCKTVVDLYVNRLTTSESAIPYDYSAFNFCESNSTSAEQKVHQNLGQILFGDRIHASPYKFSFGKNVTCESVCHRRYEADDKKLEFLKYGMLFNYENHWIVDNIPVAWCYQTVNSRQYCSIGFPMGCYVDRRRMQKDACQMDAMFNAVDTFYLFNHVDIFIRYHNGSGKSWGGSRIVKASLVPRSFKSDKCSGKPLGIPNVGKQEIDINYTYGVYFIPDNTIEWSSRWDYVLEGYSGLNIHWFSVMNSFLVVLFLSGLNAIVLMRRIPKGIAKYEELENNGDENLPEFGWKRIHGDVFRPPKKPMLLAAMNGFGMQIFVTVLVTLFLACIGLLSPANRGALGETALIFFVCFAVISGYMSAKLYKTFGGERRKANVVMTAFLFSGIIITISIALNLIFWSVGSSAAIPFVTLVAVLALWFGISMPLTIIGAYLGYKKKLIEQPVKVNDTPREIPKKLVYIRTIFSVLIGGILPFGCIFIQLFYILSSIWFHQFYYMFGFLFLVTLILVVVCSECTVLLCYFNLSREDYRWWWRSFFTSGSVSIYFYIYAIHFYVTKLQFKGSTSVIIYLGCNLIIAILMFLCCGTCGFMACFWFVTKIYGMRAAKTITDDNMKESDKDNARNSSETTLQSSHTTSFNRDADVSKEDGIVDLSLLT